MQWFGVCSKKSALNLQRKWKAMQSQTYKTIDTDLSVIHRLENESTKCQIQAGRLAVEMGSNQLHLDVPALSVVYENSQLNCFHVDTFCVPVTTDMDKTLHMQCLLFSQDKQVLNPHTLLKAHVPVSTILCHTCVGGLRFHVLLIEPN